MKRIYQQWITSLVGALFMFGAAWLVYIEIGRYTKDVEYEMSMNWVLVTGLLTFGFVLLRAKDDLIMQKLGLKNHGE